MVVEVVVEVVVAVVVVLLAYTYTLRKQKTRVAGELFMIIRGAGLSLGSHHVSTIVPVLHRDSTMFPPCFHQVLHPPVPCY